MPEDPARALRLELQDLHRDLRDLKDDLKDGFAEVTSWLSEIEDMIQGLPRAPVEVKSGA